MSKGRNWLTLAGVGVAVVLSIFFIYPLAPAENLARTVRPWKLGLDLVGGSYLIYDADMSKVAVADRETVMAGLRDVIERRVNLFGVAEPQVFTAKEGGNYRLVVNLAGVTEVTEAIRQIGLTPTLDFREVVPAAETGKEPTFRETGLTGRYIKTAQLVFDQTTREPVVTLDFDSDGAKLFEEITRRNVGKELAVFLDNRPIQVATVREEIGGGRAQISGNFKVEEARTLVERFNAGALPAPITLINQQTVSATLGADSLKMAIIAGIIGMAAIIIFMISYYGIFGIWASVALLIYTALTMAIFKAVPVTMTLSGIAGFILSIGMAIDANILIFERTREEVARGRSKAEAIEEGFKRAWTSIRDSNISTIITAVILYYLTSSFVRGFALTLLIGVIISMFSAITITRTLLRVFNRDRARGTN